MFWTRSWVRMRALTHNQSDGPARRSRPARYGISGETRCPASSRATDFPDADAQRRRASRESAVRGPLSTTRSNRVRWTRRGGISSHGQADRRPGSVDRPAGEAGHYQSGYPRAVGRDRRRSGPVADRVVSSRESSPSHVLERVATQPDPGLVQPSILDPRRPPLVKYVSHVASRCVGNGRSTMQMLIKPVGDDVLRDGPSAIDPAIAAGFRSSRSAGENVWTRRAGSPLRVQTRARFPAFRADRGSILSCHGRPARPVARSVIDRGGQGMKINHRQVGRWPGRRAAEDREPDHPYTDSTGKPASRVGAARPR